MAFMGEWMDDNDLSNSASQRQSTMEIGCLISRWKLPLWWHFAAATAGFEGGGGQMASHSDKLIEDSHAPLLLTSSHVCVFSSPPFNQLQCHSTSPPPAGEKRVCVSSFNLPSISSSNVHVAVSSAASQRFRKRLELFALQVLFLNQGTLLDSLEQTLKPHKQKRVSC